MSKRRRANGRLQRGVPVLYVRQQSAPEPTHRQDPIGNHSWSGLESLEPRLLLSADLQDPNAIVGDSTEAVVPTSIVAMQANVDGNVTAQGDRITGVKFEDLNGNGVMDAGETGLADWTIYLDANSNGELDSGETFTLTESDGTFTFSGLGPDTYLVSEVSQAGYLQTLPNFTGPLSFADGGDFSVGRRPVSIATADLNGDGWDDVVAADNLDNGLSVLLSNGLDGSGDLTFNSRIDLNVGRRPADVAIGDLDGDSDLDIAAVNSVIDDSVTVLLNDGTGSFSALGTFAVGDAPMALTIADFDLDGHNDIAVANSGSNSVSILVNSGAQTPSFSGGTTITGLSNPRAIAAGNLDTDADIDLVVANYHGDSITVLENNGNASFSSTTLSVGDLPIAIGIANIDSQNGPDIVVANQGSNNVSVLTNDGSGSFSLVGTVSAGVSGQPKDIVATDLNGDGRIDLAVSKLQADSVAVLTGVGDGTFNAASEFAVGLSPESLVASDFNQDGAVDLMVANNGLNNVRFLENGTDAVLSYNVTLEPGIVGGGATDIDFGNRPIPSITGFVFNDDNGNGVVDAAESGVVGTTVFLDTNNNDLIDPGELSTASGVGGAYAFVDIPTGTYTVRQVLDAGFTQTVPVLGAHSVTVNDAQIAANVNFGVFGAVTISGQRFTDTNGDGVKVAGEGAAPGAIVELVDAGTGSVVASMTSDIDGNYSFSGIGSGMFLVRQTILSGYTQTLPVSEYTVTTASGVDVAGLDFGNFQNIGISGLKFNDVNGDGDQDTGELGLSGWTIQVDLDSDGDVDMFTVTGVGGSYSFTGIGPGTQEVSEVLIAGWSQTIPDGVYSLTPASGVNETGVNFGNFQTTTISGTKFEDVDGDGLRDGGESTLSGWTINLDLNSDGSVDMTTTTDGSGDYVFNNVPHGTHSVSEAVADGWVQSTPADTHSVSVLSGIASTGFDFGNFQVVTISGRKFEDADGDGVRDALEVGIQGWTITLDLDSDGSTDATTLTDVNGDYQFANVGPGTHEVGEASVSGWNATTPAGGVFSVTTSSGSDVSGNDFGNFQLGSISGNVFSDAFGEGLKDPGDSPLESWTVELDLDANGSVDSVTLTDVNGDYSFGDLALGTYALSVDVPADWQQTTLDPTNVSVVASGQRFADRDFGFLRLITISGSIFHDTDGDGGRDVSESTQSGWTIELDLDADGQTDRTTLSDGSGNYAFSNVGPGNHSVKQSPRTGWTQTTPASNHSVTARSGEDQGSLNFGNFQLVSISGQKYNDIDGDGVKEVGELAIPNWQIELDLDSDGSTDVFTTTDLSGNYVFNNVGPGTHTILESSVAGWAQTEPVSAVYMSQMVSGQDLTDRDFGNFETITVTGQKFNDLNANGVKDAGEPGLAGWTIQLDETNDGSVDFTVTTQADGSYTISGVGPGRHRLSEVLPTDWRQTFPVTSVYVFDTQSDVDVSGMDFGNFKLASISGVKFRDVNGDGVKDAGEGGINAWTIGLDTNGDQTPDVTTTTDGSGAYSFSGLVPGSYTVSEQDVTGWVQTHPSNAENHTVLLSSGEQVTDVNFGNFELATITGEVFVDLDGDGVKDAGDGDLSTPVNITLDTDLDGSPDLFFATNPLDQFTIPNVAPGTYGIAIDVPIGFEQSTASHGDIVVDTSGQTFMDIDFGIFELVDVSGTKFIDANGNGAFDSGEMGIGGFTIQLDIDGDGSIDDTAVTASSGSYTFTGVGAGTHKITEAPKDGYVQTFPALGVITITPSSGVDITGQNIGNFELVTLSGQKFDDVAGDAVKDAGDGGLQGFTIQLDLNSDGSIDAETVTDTDGNYAFSGVGPGTHILGETSRAGWVQTFPIGDTHAVTTASGTDVGDLDFGNFDVVTISGQKFEDVNGDGVKGPGEPGLSGWTIQLDLNDDGSVDQETITDANGNYSFNNVTAGIHGIAEVGQSGWLQTLPAGGADRTVTVTSHGDLVSQDFGNFQLATISGVKFEDIDGDGVRETGERMIGGWTFFLDENANDQLDGGETWTTTDIAGQFQFNDLFLGTYVVREVELFGWQQSTPNPADINITASRQAEAGLEFGNFERASISGTKFEDVNGNGVMDAGEVGLQGWTIELDEDGDGTPEHVAVTDADGNYRFGNLFLGTFTITEVMQGGWVSVTGEQASVTIDTSQQDVSDIDFGNFRTLTISGRMFDDLNGDGVADAGEPGLAGWSVTLDLDSDGSVDQTVLTDASGDYSFSNVGPGTHEVGEVLRSDWVQTLPTGVETYSVVASSGVSQSGLDFGNFNLIDISGQVFGDIDGQGDKDASEAGVVGWTVALDIDGDGSIDVTDISDANGNYAIIGVGPGSHLLSFITASGYVQTVPAGSVSIDAQSGVDVTGQDFGVVEGTSISGRVYDDVNGNGQRDTGEAGLIGFTMYLDANDNSVLDADERTTVSDANGDYEFAELFIGTHIVRQVARAGWESTTADQTIDVIASPQTFPDTDFGNFQLGSVTGTIFEDNNGDGDQDAGELPLQGWTVELDLDGDGGVDATAVSQVDGSYIFTDVVGAGTHSVLLTVRSGWTQTTAVQSGLTFDSSGQVESGVDIGVFERYTISGIKFDDTDGDGIKDAGETGLSGWTINLDLDDDGSIDQTVLTDVDGNYSLTNVGPGTHSVTEELVTGWQQTTPVGGAFTVSGVSGRAVTGQNFGNFELGIAGGFVFSDLDGDGNLDAGELGVSGWTINLDLNSDGTIDRTTQTSVAGVYSFSDVGIGTHTVTQVGRSGWTQTSPPALGAHEFSLTSGQIRGDLHFGNFQLASVTGFVFEDLNGDGVQDAGEPALAGWTVRLDMDSDSIPDADTVTAGDGSYQFSNIEPGSHELVTIVPTGWVTTMPVGGVHAVSPASGETESDVNFGVFESGVIGGVVYEDIDEDGVRDPGEIGVSGWSVYLDANQNDNLDSGETFVVTDTNGVYSFDGLDVGTYRVRAVAISSFDQTSVDPADIAVATSGDSFTNVDFGEVRNRADISGRVYEDLNADGIEDAAEPALEGWSVYFDSNDNGVLDAGETVTLTNAGGSYLFSQVPLGDVVVRAELPNNWSQSNPLGDLAYHVSLGTGQSESGLDFALYQTGVIEGGKYEDANVNGVLDDLEFQNNGLEGWIVFLDTDEDLVLDPGEQFAVTDANGEYIIENIEPGTYTVAELRQDGWAQACPGAVGVTLPGGVIPCQVTGNPAPQFSSAVLDTFVEFDDGSNDDFPGADVLAFGLQLAEDSAFDVFGEIRSQFTLQTGAQSEPDGEISRANDTGLPLTGGVIQYNATIGDGTFGNSTGDYDFYQIDALAGQVISVDVDADTNFNQTSSLDAAVTLYNSNGDLLARNDNSSGQDPALMFTAPADGAYFVAVFGAGTGDPGNPFDPSSGAGVSSIVDTGPYRVTLGLNSTDVDYYRFDLEAGDVVGANITGAAGNLAFYRADESVIVGTDQDLASNFPSISPLPGGGNASAAFVVPESGVYYVSVSGNTGSYALNLRAFRPRMESNVVGTNQTLFLDFNGAIIDALAFGDSGFRVLSPLADFLADWGLSASDETALIDQIITTVEENLSTDVRVSGNNGSFPDTLREGQFDINIENSRDHQDTFGNDNISRIIIGGTQAEMKRNGVIAISESVDVGNFDTTDSAIVLLDTLSNISSDDFSLNQYAVDAGSSKVELVGRAIGNIVSQQAATIFGAYLTDADNGVITLSDGFGSNLDALAEVGTDRVFGTGDDINLQLGTDSLGTGNSLFGSQDALNAVAFGLATGKVRDTGGGGGGTIAGTYKITITPESEATRHFTDINFVNFRLGSVSGTVFEDRNADSVQNGDAGLAGWTVFLDSNRNGTFEGGEPFTFTDADGQYEFLNLTEGEYLIRVDSPLSWVTNSPATGAHAVTLSLSENVENLDFANFREGLIQGVVFEDLNANGTQDPGEDGLDGWTITMFKDENGNGELDPATEIEQIAVTNINGVYVYAGLVPGTYVVAEVEPVGWTQSIPATPSHVITLNSGDILQDVDFGNFREVSISGVVFEDSDANGDREPGEPGIEGVTIFLDSKTATNGILDPGERFTVTDADGAYSFGDLIPDVYVVTQVVAQDFIQSFPVRADESADIHQVPLASGSPATNVDFGNYREASISGVKFEDVDGDGVRDEGEPVLSGWTVFIDLNSDTQNNFGEPETVTDANGYYEFTGLKPDGFQVYEILQPGWGQSLPVEGNYAFTLRSGGTIADQDFGNYRFAGLSGKLFNDLNGDGVQDAGESPLDGWSVYLDIDNDGRFDENFDPQAVSDVNGDYTFTNLAPADYVLRLDRRDGWVPTDPVEGFRNITLLSNQTQTDADFAVTQRVTIRGQKFEDLNANGVKDAGEPGISGWGIFIDENDNGVLDPTEMSVVTGLGGEYEFVDLLPRPIYRVAELQRENWVASLPESAVYELTDLGGGDTAEDVDFGNYELVTLSGVVYDDLDADSIRDLDDPGLVGWTVILDTNGNLALDADESVTHADSDGRYTFAGLKPDDYSVVLLPIADWVQSEQAPGGGRYDLTVESGTELLDLDFGNYVEVAIYGQKFRDSDADGVKDSGEEGVSGWTIFLDINADTSLDANEPVTVTDLAGNYAFEGLRPNPSGYRVSEVARSGWFQSAPIGNGQHLVSLLSGESAFDRDFGNFQRVTIQGVKFEDVNGDASKDPGEPLIDDWTVFLDSNINGILDPGEESTQTNASGQYEFANMLPGTYVVAEQLRPGWGQSFPVQSIHTFTLGSGDVVEADFGNFRPGTFRGVKFEDRNGNGARDAGEPGLIGWTIVLDTNGNGIQDGNERVAVTSDAGEYVFVGLRPGSYSIIETPQPGWVQSHPAGSIHQVDLESGQAIEDLDFGSYRPVVIEGSKFEDQNGNSARDPGEPGLGQWTIYLDDNDNGQFDSGETFTITDAVGEFAFTGLVPGDYVVAEIVEPGWGQSFPQSATHDVSLLSGQRESGVEFGNFRFVSISGVKFNDLDGDGSQDDEDEGLPGWTIFLDANANGIVDAGEVVTTTNENGEYFFLDLRPGFYSVTEVIPTGWTQSFPASGVYALDVASGQDLLSQDFGNFERVQITGHKFEDLNADGAKGEFDPGLSDWIIYLDQNHNGRLDEAAVLEQFNAGPVDITDDSAVVSSSVDVAEAQGMVLDVSVQVNIAHERAADLSIALVSPSGTRVDLVSGLEGDGADFNGTRFDDAASVAILDGTAPFTGTFAPVGTLADFRTEDANGSWTLEVVDNEVGNTGSITDWVLIVAVADEVATVTDADGNFVFDSIAPGTYEVAEILVEDWVQSFPGDSGTFQAGGRFNATFDPSRFNTDIGEAPDVATKDALRETPTDEVRSREWIVAIDSVNDLPVEHIIDNITTTLGADNATVTGHADGNYVLSFTDEQGASDLSNELLTNSAVQYFYPLEAKQRAKRNVVEDDPTKPVGENSTTDAQALQWLIGVVGDQSVTASDRALDVALAVGATGVVQSAHISSGYILTFDSERSGADLIPTLQQTEGVVYWSALTLRQRDLRLIPNDALFSQQWHLLNVGQTGGTSGADTNVVDAWDQVLGTGVVISVVDDGLEHTHPDLVGSYRADLSFDFNSVDTDPMPTSSFDDHGTAVAGVAAGVGNNGLGISGVAPEASLSGIRLIAGPTNDLDEANALAFQSQAIDIYNNSWGPVDGFDWFDAPGFQTQAALRNGVINGRGGLGNIYVWAGGNGGEAADDVNYDGYANSRYTIAVGAIDHNGLKSSYSEPGAPLLVTAHSSGSGVGITTTDRAGSLGSASGDYRNDFGGTSSATPVVSGVVALMLEANPQLTYRDVQHILVETADVTDAVDPDWIINGGDHLVNHKYGFGAVNALAAVEASSTWQNVGPEITTGSGIQVENVAVADNSPIGHTSTVTIDDDITVEWVEVTMDIDTTFRGDLRITLTSPDGTTSVLSDRHGDGGNGIRNWRFTSARHWGESSQGTWTVNVADVWAADLATWRTWQVNFFGTDPNFVPDGGTGGPGGPDPDVDDPQVPVIGSHTVVIESGQGAEDLLFGNYRPVSISGQKFNDLNADGIKDDGEPGLAGWVMFIDQNGDAELDTNEQFVLTDVDGNYTFEGLLPGQYVISEVVQTGWIQSLPGNNEIIVTLQSGETATDIDFGNYQNVNVSGQVFQDDNQDGVINGEELGIGDWVVFLDANQNGSLDSGEVSTTTDVNGNYAFSDLLPATYTVAQVLQPLYVQSAPASVSYTLDLTGGTGASAIDFGNYEVGEIVGQLFDDTNGNGTREFGEAPLNGWTVELYDTVTGLLLSTATTGATDLNLDGTIDPETEQGVYTFGDIPEGEYEVRQQLNPGYLQVSPGLLAFGDRDYLQAEVPRVIRFADLNRDLLPDMITINERTDSLSILINNGDLTFTPSSNSIVIGSQPAGLAVEDLDGDTDLDLVVTSLNNNTMTVLFNNGEGVMSVASVLATGNRPVAVATGDFDRNGAADIVVANRDDDSISMFLNAGAGVFGSAGSFAVGDDPSDIGVGDFDNDGDPDLIVANFLSDDISILRNTGQGAFAPQVRREVGDGPLGITIADLNEDDAPDAALVNWFDGTVTVLNNTGNTTFEIAQVAPVNEQPESLVAGDIDGDGDLDLAVANRESDNISVLLNVGTGVFQPAVDFDGGDGPQSITAGDVEGDGDLDLAVSDFFASTIRLLRNVSFAHAVDVIVQAGSGRVSSVDFANALPASISGSKYLDVNGDGVRDQFEQGLEGWQIFVDANDNGLLDPDEFWTTTDVNGDYTLTDLLPGDYVIGEVVGEGFGQSAPGTGTHSVSVISGGTVTGVDFGNYVAATVSGTKFEDQNGNGIREGGEPGLEGWTIYADLDNSGSRDAGEPWATTNANGFYTIGDVPPGAITIREELQIGWVQTFPGGTGTHTVTLISDEDVTNVNFGNANRPDLVGLIESTDVPSSFIPGDRVNVPVTILNQGVNDAIGRVDLKVYMSTTPDLSGTTVLLKELTNQAINIRPGADRIINVGVRIPEDLASGEYHLVADLVSDARIGESDITNNRILSTNTHNLSLLFGSFLDRRNVRLTVLDGTTKISLALTGGGFGAVTFVPGGGIDLDIEGTGDRSALRITTVRGEVANVRNITIDGSMRSITGTTTNLGGDLQIAGSINALTLGDLTASNNIVIGSSAFNREARIRLGSVADTSITSDIPIKQLIADSWVDTDAAKDTITAPSMGVARIRGSFGASLQLTNAAGLYTLDSFLADSVADSAFTITGNVNRISVGEIGTGWTADVSGEVRNLTVRRDVGGTAVAAGAKTVNITADQLRTAYVRGDMRNTAIDLLFDKNVNDSNEFAMRVLRVNGTVENSEIRSAGNVGVVTLGELIDSDLFVGVDADVIRTLPAPATDFSNPAMIRSVTVRGIRGSGNALVNSHIAAFELQKVNILGPIQFANGGTKFGLAANNLDVRRLASQDDFEVREGTVLIV